VREWSYYGAAHRYDVHYDPDTARRCVQVMRELRLAGDENELRRRAGAGDRCAVITLFEVLVDADRLDELRALQEAGDDRAGVTLMEALFRQGREGELRREVDAGQDVMWLVNYLSDAGRVDEALSVLEEWAKRNPELRRLAHARGLDVLLEHGHIQEVRRAAESGDYAAARRLRGLLDS
jgi:hypothetical protein